MSNKVFDESISGLPDLNIIVDPNLMVKTGDQKAGDELVIPESPTRAEYKLSTSEIFVMRKKQKQEENIKLQVEEEKRESMRESEEQIVNDGISKEVVQDDLVEFEKEKKTLRGKRGGDKKPRKKRVMTDKQKENLKKAREKSLAVRRAKKAAKQSKLKPIKEIVPPVMPRPRSPPPVQNQAPMSYEYFADMMDKYENRRKKKHTTTADPHPNKIIPQQQKPRPPVQRVQRVVKVRTPPTSFDPYAILNNNRVGNKSLFGGAFGY